MRIFLSLVVLAVLLAVSVFAGEKVVCEDWAAAECLYAPSGNIQVWSPEGYSGGSHAVCLPMERFSEKTLEKKLADGWSESSKKEGYICKWSS